jgi:hypothetical protein
VKYPERLSEYLFGSKDQLAQHGGADDLKRLRPIRERWNLAKPLDSANYFALRRQRERLQSSGWKKFAEAVQKNDYPAASTQLTAISRHLEHQPASPTPPEMMPLSIDDVDRANRWLAGEAAPNESSVHTELDVCRQTLAKIRETPVPPPIRDISKPDKEPAKR